MGHRNLRRHTTFQGPHNFYEEVFPLDVDHPECGSWFEQKKQGRPNGYIVGRESGGSFILGLRYGSGTLNHRVEGEKPVYWTGPSLGMDAGANSGSAFILVYNLYDTEDMYNNFGAAEGAAYVGGGFNVGHMRRGDVVLIPIRVGAGLRLGMNVGYMRFSKKQRWRPF
jgi:hypothetical protein